MKIKSLQLKNVRSYSDEKIDFPNGNILFEGDIGSGKSTILLAIEFALFGLTADLPGANLLRTGQKQGGVTLTFESEGKDYKIYRSLIDKAGSIVQEQGYIIFDTERYNYSPKELRAKVLQILNFNEDVAPRSSSKFFRYAIFIPQEEIKTILNLKPTDRLQTLRKAFGVEDYKTSKENAQLLVREIKSKIDTKKGFFSDLEHLEKTFEESSDNLNEIQSKLSGSVTKIISKEKELTECEIKVKELQSQKEQIASLQSKLKNIQDNINYKASQLTSLESRFKQNENRLQDQQNQLNSFEKIEKPWLNEDQLRDKISELKQSFSNEQLNFAKLQASVDNYKTLVEKEVCPTCEQKVDSALFGEKISTVERTKQEKEVLLKETQIKLKDFENKLENLRKCLANEKQIQMLQNQIDERKKSIEHDSEEIKKIKEEIQKLNIEDQESKKEFEKLNEFVTNFDKLTAERTKINSELQQLISEKASHSQRMKDIIDMKEKLAEQIVQKKVAKKRKEELDQTVMWVQDFFIPTLDSIEKHVMYSLNTEFNSQFRYWFNLLMESSEIRVDVDETFTPQIEQNGYTLDVNALSGGEKTSVALSYRLALNNLVKQICSSLKSNLLIMDEPTDGFSKEQLSKIKDVLESLDCEQTIIVSHERELESFVDSIFRIEKEGHRSKIKKLT